MKGFVRVVLAMAFVGVGFAACHGSMANLKAKAASDAKDTGCETSCDEAKDKCNSECAGTDENGEVKDSAACELACDEARKKCESDCKK